MKTFKKIVFIIIVVFITVNIFKLLKEEHNVNYKVDNYSVKEHFYVSNGELYDLVIKDKNNTYIYTINEKHNKDKRIIKKIKTFKKDDLVCILPIYKKNIKNNLYCNLSNKQVSIDYLNKSNSDSFKDIYEQAKKYKVKLTNDDDTKTKYKKLTIYKKNIPTNHVYFVWDYKGIYVITRDDIKYKKFIDYDIYDNVMSCVADNYYVLFENNSVNGIENIYYYDIKKDKVDKFKLEKKISKDSYINGVINDLIYVTDKREKKEYTISVKNENIVEVDDEQTSYIVYENGEKKELTKSDYFLEEISFNDKLFSDEKITIAKELKKEYNYYYFIENSEVYKVLDSNKKNRILLAELKNISDWMIRDRELILLSEDTVYSYTDQWGLRKILSTNELKYNYKNIYNLWKE